jgi:hypothetical protein
MRHKTYWVRYSRTCELFERQFEESHFAEINLPAHWTEQGMPRPFALELMNKWNRQNGNSGFTYWVEP